MFENTSKKWNLHINPYFFCIRLSEEERIAVLVHELFHIIHKHPFRAPFIKVHPKRRRYMNIAMDLSINQLIPNLPMGCDECRSIDIEEQTEPCKNTKCPGRACLIEDMYDKDDNGNKIFWDKNKSWEHYYQKFIKRLEESEDPNEKVMKTVKVVVVRVHKNLMPIIGKIRHLNLK